MDGGRCSGGLVDGKGSVCGGVVGDIVEGKFV